MLQDAKAVTKPLKRNKSTGILLPGPSLIPPGPPSTLKRQLSRKSLSKLDHPAASEGAAEEEAGNELVIGQVHRPELLTPVCSSNSVAQMVGHLEWAPL